MRQPIVIISLLIAFTSITYGQQNPNRATAPPQEQETLRVSTASVQVEAIVTDKSGRRINGLTASDFHLTDEAKPQSIDFFSVIEGSRVQHTENRGASSNAAATGNSVTTTTSPLVTPYRGRHIALVFDDLNLSAENFLRAQRSFADYINNKLDTNDLVAIISTGGSFGSMQQFTNDKQRLLSALNRIAYQGSQSARASKTPFDMTPAEAVRIDSGDPVALRDVKVRAANEESAVPAGTIGAQPISGAGGGIKDTQISGADSSLETRIRQAARAMVSQMSQATRANLRTLETLFHGMADLPGRKIVVLLTESLMTAGGTSEDVSNQIVQLIEVARRAGVSVYALDAQGLNARNTTASEYTTGSALYSRNAISESSSSDFEKLGAARSLVVGTGGALIGNTNDLANGLDRALEDSSTYYVLGFRPAVLDNKFHHLTVTVKDRSDLIVRTRRGYLAVNQETVAGTNTELAAALISLVPRIDLPLEVVANAVPKDKEQIVIVGLHVGRNYLSLPEPSVADQIVAYDVLAWVFATGRDQPVGIIKRTITFDLAKQPQDRDKLKTTGFVYVPAPLTLPAGSYQIRAVVREKTSGAVGSAYQFFEVPDVTAKKVVTMSSIVLTNAGQNGFSGHYSFKHGSEIQMGFVIYNLPKDSASFSQQVKLINSAGGVLMDSPLAISGVASSSDPSQFPQGTQLSVPTVRGQYALVVTLRDVKGKVNVERRADFVVD